MSRILALSYGIVSYLLFFACLLYSIAFVGNLDLAIVPKTIDSGTAGSVTAALGINVLLLTVFAVQHSVMARPAFKRVWTKLVPQPIERSTYVLASTAALVFLYWGWQPIEGTVWNVESALGSGILTGLYFFGWGFLLYATALIDHFDLFGVRQVVLYARGKQYTNHPFATPGLYRHLRHPIYLGWLTIFWATPHMTLGHLFFTVVTSVYIMLAVLIEERDLVVQFGDAYRRYQETTPKYFPRLRGTGQSQSSVSAHTD